MQKPQKSRKAVKRGKQAVLPRRRVAGAQRHEFPIIDGKRAVSYDVLRQLARSVVLHGLVRRKASVEEAYETALENWLHAWATGTNEEKRKAITALEKAQNEYENFPPAQPRKHPSETVGASKDGALVKPFTPKR